MANLEIKCPFCGGSARIRTSERPTILSIKAQVYCSDCGQLKADFFGQIANIRRAVFVECNEANNWEKTEKELIKEGKIQAKSNEQRLKELKGSQPDLFSQPKKSQLDKINTAYC